MESSPSAQQVSASFLLRPLEYIDHEPSIIHCRWFSSPIRTSNSISHTVTYGQLDGMTSDKDAVALFLMYRPGDA